VGKHLKHHCARFGMVVVVFVVLVYNEDLIFAVEGVKMEENTYLVVVRF
jgi:hypothetical protein